MWLKGLIDAVLWGVSLLVAVPAFVLFLQLVAACAVRRPNDRTAPRIRTAGQRLAVLMPAHDEAAGIGAALAAVFAQRAAFDRVLVVADNCSDDTASVARAAGAEVVERHDRQRRGKGYALDFGVRWLERDPPAVVVVVDADCIVAPAALGQLADTCLASGRPVQALYLMKSPAASGVGMRIAEFAWLVKNQLRPAGCAVLGWPCQLMGTGMAFPWQVIRQAPLATGHLVEDMQLGLDLAHRGTAPLFCEQALVGSAFPTDREAVRSQRTRWEHGHLSVIASVGPRTLWRSLVQRDFALLAMAFDLMVPPLASLVLTLAVLFLINAVWFVYSGFVGPVALTALALGLMTAGVMAAWRKEGQRIVSLQELFGMPLYIAAKIPVYLRLFSKRQVEWVRTKRDDRRH